MKKRVPVVENSWSSLRRLTSARIALGRCGGGLPTQEWLDFKLDHASARDAVHCEFEAERILKDLKTERFETIILDTLAPDRRTYLQRPDLGRYMSNDSKRLTESMRGCFDLVVIVSDGLSATAVHVQAMPLLKILIPQLRQHSWDIAPIIIARFGRVALQDEIGAALGAEIALILIGERPGLGSPDSLGAYLVFNPQPGNTDANRNCVSNIRPEGLNHNRAASSLFYLLTQSKEKRISGVGLKDWRRGLDEKEECKALPP